MSTLSACMLVQNSEKTLAIALESLGRVYDELIVVDGGSTDRTCDIAIQYGARIIHSKWTGDYSEQRNVYLRAVKTDWVFVLDSDEFIDCKTLDFLRLIKEDSIALNTDNIWIARRWISPDSHNHYIASSPHNPDIQNRLFKYNQDLYYSECIHEFLQGLNPIRYYQENCCIYHLDLFINSESKRQEKVRRYMDNSPLSGALHFYLPSIKNLRLAEWDSQDILPGTRSLLNNLIASNMERNEGSISQDSHVSRTLEQDLPIHFLTIVLNGEPFIRYHIEIFKQLPFKWHWHIVEGVAELKHDTAWSVKLGGSVSNTIHNKGRSIDGTSEYLDELVSLYPQQVTIYRKPEQVFWDGKREMVNEPLITNIREECLLWQVDADELWTVKQICTMRQMFIDRPDKTAAFYWCWYFVGEKLVISTRNCYANNPRQDWLRTWRYKPGCVWLAHEPPILMEPQLNGQWRDIAKINAFTHQETEEQGLVFQHFAYVTPKQLRFKEKYYGYTNALKHWTNLQANSKFPILLHQYFPWVQDYTMVDTVEALNLVPLLQKQADNDLWQRIDLDTSLKIYTKFQKMHPCILIDGVFFQLYKAGIERIWKALLEEWTDNGFAKYITVLDRQGSAPKIPGIKYRLVSAYDYNNFEEDREMLQQVCDEEEADLFISTYYTRPLSTPSALMVYDMIPEAIGADTSQLIWRLKHDCIRQASTYIAISQNTARDLVRFFPEISRSPITIAPCGVQKDLSPTSVDEINSWKNKYGISKPYFLLVSIGDGSKKSVSSYKNTILFFQSFSLLVTRLGFEIVCTGSGRLDPDYRIYTAGTIVHHLELNDEELRAAYSGAVAVIYPSKYEGFGLPLVEAMTCGCPVITCPNSSIPEVAGSAALYVKDDDVEGLVEALCEIQKPTVRHRLIAQGLQQTQKFSWDRMAETVSAALIEATLLRLNLRAINLIIFPDWSLGEESLYPDLQAVLKFLLTNPKKREMTLLIEIGELSEEEANLILSSVTMNFLMEEDLEIVEEPSISLMGKLGDIQWKSLLPKVDYRICLESENLVAIQQASADILRSCNLEDLQSKFV